MHQRRDNTTKKKRKEKGSGSTHLSHFHTQLALSPSTIKKRDFQQLASPPRQQSTTAAFAARAAAAAAVASFRGEREKKQAGCAALTADGSFAATSCQLVQVIKQRASGIDAARKVTARRLSATERCHGVGVELWQFAEKKKHFCFEKAFIFIPHCKVRGEGRNR